jgi:TonB family protein
LQGNSQEYDSKGRVLKGGAEGPWTLFGRIKVDEIELSADRLTFKGHRVDYKHSSSTMQLEPVPNKIRMQVAIILQSPLASLAQADELLHHVFALTREDVVASFPELWRDYFERQQAPKQTAETTAARVDGPETTPRLLLRGEPVDKPAHVGRSVSAPQAVFTPEPSYTDRASQENYAGIVVLSLIIDKTDKPQTIRLVRALGMGLDEAAVAAVKTWQFKPAKREGEPVAVEMNIEVAFNKF